MRSITKIGLILLFISSWFILLLILQHFLARTDAIQRQTEQNKDKLINELNEKLSKFEERLKQAEIHQRNSETSFITTPAIESEYQKSKQISHLNSVLINLNSNYNYNNGDDKILKAGDTGKLSILGVDNLVESTRRRGVIYLNNDGKIEEIGFFIPMKMEEKKRILWTRIDFVGKNEIKNILITGGSGFVGSHLVDRLMLSGHRIFVIDNFHTGNILNLDHWLGHTHFFLINCTTQDAPDKCPVGDNSINELNKIKLDEIYHLASPASPVQYMKSPVETLKTNTLGTINMLELAKQKNATILLASTSEIYGDPYVHPQRESYWGNVNPMGPRSCYDEGKRSSEALSYAYWKQFSVDIRVARIFNTYGPRMQINDGRVVSNFISQALQNKNITIYGRGQQTRSFQFITDLVDGIVFLMAFNSAYSQHQPINLGNPDEYDIVELARIIKRMIPESRSNIVFSEELIDDPKKRRPDITRAQKLLHWSPRVKLMQGLIKTIDYFRDQI